MADEFLRSWKAIAAHLDVSVRTAQHWEAAHGLPVRRVAGHGRGSVYALKSDLNDWLAAQKSDPRQNLGGLEGPSRKVGTPRRRWIAAAAALVTAGAASAVYWSKAHRPVARASAVGEWLVAWAADGTELWRRHLPPNFRGEPLVDKRPRAVVADFEGKGHPVVLLFGRYSQEETTGGAGGIAVYEEITCFSSQGAVLWKHRPEPVVQDAAGRPFTPHWGILSVLVTRDGPVDRVWYAACHQHRFPGVLVLLTPDGKGIPHFANCGHIGYLAARRVASKYLLYAGGTSNAYNTGFLAVIDPDAQASIPPPGGPARYRFANFGPLTPLHYLLFPPTCVTTGQSLAYNRVALVEVLADSIIAHVAEGAAESGCFLAYEFSPTLQPRVVRYRAACSVIHAELERGHHVDHPFGRCPYFRRSIALRWWQPQTGWRTVNVPVATMKNLL